MRGGEVVRSRNLGAGPRTRPILLWTTSSRTCSRPPTWSSRRGRRRRSASRAPRGADARCRRRRSRPPTAARCREPAPDEPRPTTGASSALREPVRRRPTAPTSDRPPQRRPETDLLGRRRAAAATVAPAAPPAAGHGSGSPPSTPSWSADASSPSPAAPSPDRTRATRSWPRCSPRPAAPVFAVTAGTVRRAPRRSRPGPSSCAPRTAARSSCWAGPTVAWVVDDEEPVVAGAVLGIVAGSPGDPPGEPLLVLAIDPSGTQVDAVALLVGLPDPGELDLLGSDPAAGVDPYRLDLELAASLRPSGRRHDRLRAVPPREPRRHAPVRDVPDVPGLVGDRPGADARSRARPRGRRAAHCDAGRRRAATPTPPVPPARPVPPTPVVPPARPVPPDPPGAADSPAGGARSAPPAPTSPGAPAVAPGAPRPPRPSRSARPADQVRASRSPPSPSRPLRPDDPHPVVPPPVPDPHRPTPHQRRPRPQPPLRDRRTDRHPHQRRPPAYRPQPPRRPTRGRRRTAPHATPTVAHLRPAPDPPPPPARRPPTSVRPVPVVLTPSETRPPRAGGRPGGARAHDRRARRRGRGADRPAGADGPGPPDGDADPAERVRRGAPDRRRRVLRSGGRPPVRTRAAPTGGRLAELRGRDPVPVVRPRDRGVAALLPVRSDAGPGGAAGRRPGAAARALVPAVARRVPAGTGLLAADAGREQRGPGALRPGPVGAGAPRRGHGGAGRARHHRGLRPAEHRPDREAGGRAGDRARPARVQRDRRASPPRPTRRPRPSRASTRSTRSTG